MHKFLESTFAFISQYGQYFTVRVHLHKFTQANLGVDEVKPVCRMTGSLWEANVKHLLCFKFVLYLAVQQLSCVDKRKEKEKKLAISVKPFL